MTEILLHACVLTARIKELEAEIANLHAQLAAPVAAQEPIGMIDPDGSVVLWERPVGARLYAAPVAAQPAQGERLAALELAAATIELYDDATMLSDYMLDSTECAGIIRAMKSMP